MRTKSQQSKPTVRGYRYRAASASLAMLVLLLSFASVSPALHSWLHADPECGHHHDDHGHAPEHSESSDESDSHYCAVTLLGSGTTLFTQVELPQLGDALITTLSIQHESVWYQRPRLSQYARGPPTVIVV